MTAATLMLATGIVEVIFYIIFSCKHKDLVFSVEWLAIKSSIPRPVETKGYDQRVSLMFAHRALPEKAVFRHSREWLIISTFVACVFVCCLYFKASQAIFIQRRVAAEGKITKNHF